MKWSTPLDPGSITGKQTLTGDKPITHLLRAGKEIQELAVTAAEITINGTPLDCSVVGNTLRASGEIPSSLFSSSGKITMITGIVPTLTASGTTLTLTLAFTAVELDLETSETKTATMEDAIATLDGKNCGV